MPHERLRPEYHFDEERIDALREIAPEAFADGKINWATLKEALGTQLEDEEADTEHFGLFWPGKREARRFASIPSSGTLIPTKGEGIDEKSTNNIYIEGENLEVLKILRKGYTGRIRMIYIYPPYNTGNDFIYDDDFTEPLQEYLKRTGQIDGEGRPLTTTKRADGRYHSKWLSMMYPRLRLARELLRNDGVIFISIDDNEVAKLRHLCDEIFGEENFIATVIWQKVFSPKNTAAYFSEDHDYVIVYARQKSIWEPGLIPRSEENIGRYTNPDNDERGPWMSGAIQARNYYSKGQYEVQGPSGKTHKNPKGTYWRFSKERFLDLDADNRIWWGADGNNVPRLKRFLSEVKEGVVPQTLWRYEQVGHTQEAKEELLKYVDFEHTENVLNSVKPTRLLRYMLQIGTSTKENDIILDFFSGSAPTGHATLLQNFEDGGNRRFILVQIPEPLPREEPRLRTISDLGKRRLSNVISELKTLSNNENGSSLGFKVYVLSKSHYKQWQNYQGNNVEELESLFEEHSTPLIDNWKTIEDGLFTEILLLEGFPLDSSISELQEYSKNSVRRVECTFHESRLLICLDDNIDIDTINRLDLDEKDTFICLDTAIDDQTKTTLADKGLIKTI